MRPRPVLTTAAALLTVAALSAHAACDRRVSDSPKTRPDPLSLVAPGTSSAPGPDTAPVLTRAEAEAIVDAYHTERARLAGPGRMLDVAAATARWSDRVRTDALAALEEGDPAEFTLAAADRVRRYGATRAAAIRSIYEFTVPRARSRQVYLPPRGSGDWFLATTTQTPLGFEDVDKYRRPEYLWFHRGSDGAWRVAWWLMALDWSGTTREARAPRSLDGTWNPPGPAPLAADPSTVCAEVAVLHDVDNASWDARVRWGPQARVARDKVKSLWNPRSSYTRDLADGGTHRAVTSVRPEPAAPAWELADGGVMVPCAITYAQTMEAAPGRTLSLWNSGFEQSIDADRPLEGTAWTRWDSTSVIRVLVVVPPAGGTTDFEISLSWPLYASGNRVR